jgi:hypothetical protein
LLSRTLKSPYVKNRTCTSHAANSFKQCLPYSKHLGTLSIQTVPMSPTASSLSAVAVLLTTIVVAHAASTPSLADLFHSKRFPSVSTASASVIAHEENYSYEGSSIETKELCLQETVQKTCSWVSNCIDDPVVGDPFPRPQPGCVYGQYWT